MINHGDDIHAALKFLSTGAALLAFDVIGVYMYIDPVVGYCY
jgi:hypothetical protein